MRTIASIALVVSALASSPASACWGSARPYGEKRACWSTQKTLAGALEMYFADDPQARSTWLGSLPPDAYGVFPRRLFEALKEKGFLQVLPFDERLPEGLESRYLISSSGLSVMCLGHGQIGSFAHDQANARAQLVAAGVKDQRLLDLASTAHAPERFHNPPTLAEQLTMLFAWLLILGAPALFYLSRTPTEAAGRCIELGGWGVGSLLASFAVACTPLALIAFAPGLYAVWCLYLAQGALGALVIRGLGLLILPRPSVRLVLRRGGNA